MKYFVFVCLLIIASCDGGDQAPLEQAQQPSCEGMMSLCMEKQDWQINSHLSNFPFKISLALDGVEYFNECTGGNYPFMINRDAAITLEAQKFSIPSSKLKLEIFDLGSDCLQKTSFYLNPEQPYTINNGVVEINLN